ncbi:hypothetical protein GDO86_000358 [Hymenochirus boettgeri]|uniref:Uncharacterized protein n=1 Tax=Hymenochirus boettgeri TaxID=247094 RepID=A0A8T2KBC1_9PIPI|nr:hypothetical protein GDO86_000358 [Hymenochirus boettgeri]
MILSSKGKREKSPYSQEVEMLSNSSRVVKEHDNIPMDEDVDESFDPPLHSTAVYTDTEEALEKIKPCSPSSKSETVESSGTTQENTVFKNTIKAPKNKKILAKKVSSFGKHPHPESVNENKAGNTSHTSIQAKKRKRNNRENLVSN